MTAGEIVQPGEGHSRAAVLEQADNTGLERLSELTVFAIPLFRQGDLVQLVYLPMPAKEVPSESKSHVPQKLRDYAQKTQVGQDLLSGNHELFMRSTEAGTNLRAYMSLMCCARSSLPACGNSGVNGTRESDAGYMTWVSVRWRMLAPNLAC